MSPTSFPRSVPCSGRPFPDRVLVGRVPRRHRYNERLRLLVTLAAMLLRASFPSLGGTSCARRVRVPRCGSCALDARLAQASGLLCGEPDAPLARGGDETSQVPGAPLCARAPLFDPGGASAPMIVGRSGAAFRCLNGVGLHVLSLSGLNHAAHALAVYASRPSSRTSRARLASGWRSAFAGQLGSSDHEDHQAPKEVSATFIRSSLPPPPGFSWRTQPFSACRERRGPACPTTRGTSAARPRGPSFLPRDGSRSTAA